LVLFGVFLGAAWWVAWGVKKKRYASALGHSSLAAASASLLLLFVGVLVGF
jgi:cbb3-type cytochrome oxidase subunit 3